MTTSKSKWIWFPGDREIWLGNQFNNRRTERGAMFPPFWKQDSHWQTVEFSKEIDLLTADTLHITVEGIYNFMLDGKLQFGQPRTFAIPAGKHKLNIKVHNVAVPPSLHIQGEQPDSPANTDETWLATCEDKIWIDENGVAHGSGIYLTPGTWPGCDDPDILPSKFELLQTVPMEPIRSSLIDNRSSLYDFGRETFGYIVLHNARGPVEIYYGESEAEALDKEYCETLDKVVVSEFQEVSSGVSEFQVPGSKAFRFVQVVGDVERISMLYEYLPQDPDRSASFECSDPELNKIWEVGAYTMDLTTREFMMDGIKRDRWTWSGDAIQSYLMNYYLRFDSEAVKRTIRQLRGKDPVTAHVNTILDYTFYWFNALGDYYLYTGDVSFINEMYTRAKSLMDYTLGRLTDEGLAIGQPDDWVFVDWVDFPMHKRGILCFEQILLYKSLQTMAQCAELAGDTTVSYASMAEALRTKTDQLFWDEEKHAYLHALEDPLESPSKGEDRTSMVLNEQITKFPNMMAILYGFANEERQQEIMKHVMQNDQVPAITTPYMRFYELAARCQHGQQEAVLGEIKSYWGGMLRNGATSFWEKYNPEENGQMSNDKGQMTKVKGQMSTPSPQPPHLEMYGRPYGKSLCHAWGASPIYLLGKYYLGVEPTEPGYASYTVTPNLGGLASMSGKVPTPFGPICIQATKEHLTVTAPQGIGIGTVIFNGQTAKLLPGETLTL